MNVGGHTFKPLRCEAIQGNAPFCGNSSDRSSAALTTQIELLLMHDGEQDCPAAAHGGLDAFAELTWFEVDATAGSLHFTVPDSGISVTEQITGEQAEELSAALRYTVRQLLPGVMASARARINAAVEAERPNGGEQ